MFHFLLRFGLGRRTSQVAQSKPTKCLPDLAEDANWPIAPYLGMSSVTGYRTKKFPSYVQIGSYSRLVGLPGAPPSVFEGGDFSSQFPIDNPVTTLLHYPCKVVRLAFRETPLT